MPGQLIESARGGKSRVRAVRGEPGMGRTALLDYTPEQARGCQVVRPVGVRSEMERAFAAVHQLTARNGKSRLSCTRPTARIHRPCRRSR